MVEINNQSAYVRYVGVVGGNWITDVRNQKSWLASIVGGERCIDYSDHPRKLHALNSKLNQQARRLPAFPVMDVTASSLA